MSFFAVLLGLGGNLFSRMESLTFISLQVVEPEQLADSESNLCLSPFRQAALLDLLERCGSVLDDAFNEKFILLLAPVVALLDIEIFEIE